MAGDAALQLTWHLSQGTVGIGNNDSDLSLGNGRANANPHRHAGLLTAVSAVGDTRIFYDNVTADYAGRWLYFRDGNLGTFATLILFSDSGTGRVEVVDPLPFTGAIGDSVWVFDPDQIRMPFKPTTALESASGFTEYIGMYLNNAGSAISDFAYHLEVITPGEVVHEIAASSQEITFFTLPLIADRFTAPSLASMHAGGGAGTFVAALSHGSGSPFEFNLTTGVWGFWIKRIAPTDAPRQSDQAIRIVGESLTAGIRSTCVLSWRTAGFTPVIVLTHAPTVYTGGGARFRAHVTAQETGLVVPDVPASMQLIAGPGTLRVNEGETDAAGDLIGVYEDPDDVAEVGNTFEVEATV